MGLGFDQHGLYIELGSWVRSGGLEYSQSGFR